MEVDAELLVTKLLVTELLVANVDGVGIWPVGA